jgi:restriction endonuclease S subunit
LPQENEKIKKLQEILRKGQRYPSVPLDDFIIPIEDKIKPSQYPDDEFIVLGVANDKGIFINEKKKGEEINQNYYKVKKGYFCYNPYRVNVGSIGLNEYDFENQIISGAYNVFKVDESSIEPKYLFALFKSKKFLDCVNELATGGVRMDFKIDYLKKWKIPLPPLEIQKEIVEKIEKQKAIIEGVKKIVDSWEISIPKVDGEKYLLRDLIKTENIHLSSGDFLPQQNYISGEYPVYGGNGIQGYHNQYNFNNGSISIGRVGALCGCVHFVDKKCWITDNAFALVVKNKIIINEKYLYYILKVANLNQYKTQSAQPSINQECIKNLVVVLPPLEIQQKIVDELDKEMEALEKVKLLKEKAEKRIEEILNEVWGEEK